ncbi:MAG: FAD-dependent oxidoreductase, partial [Actinomycetota bacterium]
MAIVVVGAGVAGLTASLALARDGNDVVLVERDGIPESGAWTSDLADARPGCPQINQGHSFLARARSLLEQHAPDVLQAMLDAGGNVTDGNLVLPPEHHDPDLRAIAIRRALIDRVLLDAVRAEPRISHEPGTVSSLIAGGTHDGIPSIAGVQTADGRRFAADLVVDASGRRSPFPALLEAIGARPPVERSMPCGIIYYGVFVEAHPDIAMPPMFAPIAVRASLGHIGFAIFWQDARYVILALSAETADREMRALRHEAAFLATCRAIKPMAHFADEAFGTKRTGVVSMGGLHNVRRSFVHDGAPLARGLVVIGDGLCHTDPTPA